MVKITLGQLLQYFDRTSDYGYRLQVVTNSRNWENVDEFSMNSEILDQFLGYEITEMSYEESYFDQKPVLRIGINYP